MSASIVIKKWIFVLIPLLVVAVAAAVIGLGLMRGTPQMPMPPQQIQLEEIKYLAASSTLKAVAIVEANESVDLKARVAGFLVGKYFEEGQEVKTGQVLFRIEPDQYQAAMSSALADVSSAQAQMDKATLDYTRAKDLYNKRSTPKSDFDTAQASLDVATAALQSARARLSQAKLNLDYTTIKAPFDGFISDTPFSVGSLLGPESATLATVVAKDPVEVSFGISDTVMGGVRLGDERSGLPGSRLDNIKPRLLLGSGDYYDIDGEITYVAPQIDRQTDTVKFKVRFKNPKGILAPGQSVVVSLEPIEPRKVLILPKSSLMTSSGQSFVYTAEPAPDGGQGLVAAIKPVKIGYEFNEGFEILSGLKEGDKVIVLGLMSMGARLRPGAGVVVVNGQAQGSGQPAAIPAAGIADQAPTETDESTNDSTNDSADEPANESTGRAGVD
ncbi:MAG: efflux RND transporter periplasmic adaptor subunit [Deltaproteobacteria bacterium]|jgi:membrane fusion protein (multidrug efflux system)|nr:efflux RND transporter periplasmic adaptor subunit [Deltaproteobacteria bacterium]